MAPAILATLITRALVAGELTDAAQRRWWAARPLTTDTVAGLLVVLITVLVVHAWLPMPVHSLDVGKPQP